MEESETGREVSINEVDSDNFIRAKGAIFSTIDTLLSSVDMTVEMIDKVYVAGGIGSSSLTGAYAMVMREEAITKCAEVAANMAYLELRTHPGYMDSFVAACFIPHTDNRLFPNSIQA